MISIPDITVIDFHKYFKECVYQAHDGDYYLLNGVMDAEGFKRAIDVDQGVAVVQKLSNNGDLATRWGNKKEIPVRDLLRDLNMFHFPVVAGWRMAAEGKLLTHYRYKAAGGRARGFTNTSFESWTPDESRAIMDASGIGREVTKHAGLAFRLLKEQLFVPINEAVNKILNGEILSAAVSPQMAMVLSGADDNEEFPIKIFLDRKIVGKVSIAGQVTSLRPETEKLLNQHMNKAA